MSSVLTFAREPHRRAAVRVESWWGRALLRAIEEQAYDDNQLSGARALARSGQIGGLVLEPGRLAAAVEDERGLWTVSGTVPELDAEARAALVEVFRAAPARLDALFEGDLPLDVAEHAEEAGVELVPYGDEITVTCSCGHWHAVCAHSLAVLHQVSWLVDRDASVLLLLRGMVRDELVREVRAGLSAAPVAADGAGDHVGERAGERVDDVEIALDAVLRARHMLED